MSASRSLRSRDYWTTTRLDILSELRLRGLDHVVERVAASLDPTSARAARRVSREWREMRREAADAVARRRRRRRRRLNAPEANGRKVEEAAGGVTAMCMDEKGIMLALGMQDGRVGANGCSRIL